MIKEVFRKAFESAKKRISCTLRIKERLYQWRLKRWKRTQLEIQRLVGIMNREWPEKSTTETEELQQMIDVQRKRIDVLYSERCAQNG